MEIRLWQRSKPRLVCTWRKFWRKCCCGGIRLLLFVSSSIFSLFFFWTFEKGLFLKFLWLLTSLENMFVKNECLQCTVFENLPPYLNIALNLVLCALNPCIVIHCMCLQAPQYRIAGIGRHNWICSQCFTRKLISRHLCIFSPANCKLKLVGKWWKN